MSCDIRCTYGVVHLRTFTEASHVPRLLRLKLAEETYQVGAIQRYAVYVMYTACTYTLRSKY